MTFVWTGLNQDKYCERLQTVEEISGVRPEYYLNKNGYELAMANIDSLLQQIFLSYMGLSDDSKKA